MIRANLAAVQEKIARAAQHSGREPKDITLVAVTKKVSAERVLEAVSAGAGHLGESYVQEAQEKIGSIKGAQVRWHMIGSLQSNKAARAVEIFNVIQSVDSLKLLRFIDRKAGELKKIQDCFVEINLAGEKTKGGLAEADIDKFFEASKEFKNVKIGGIMTMAPFFDSQDKARPYFARARKIFEKHKLPELSMGMSGDFEAAIEEGSTMVRIGQANF